MLVDTYYKMRSEKNDIKRTWHRTEGDHPVCGRQRSAQTALFGYGTDQGCGSNGCEIAPMGDPIELKIHGYELTIRLDDAEKIEVKEIKAEEKQKERKVKRKSAVHPGYGEGGKYHEKETENPLADSEVLTFALVGNQNCGKTTLFNQRQERISMSEIFRA